MPRTYNVTSTINTSIVSYLAYNREKAELETRTATIKLADDMTADNELKAMRNKIDIETCAVVAKTTVSALYGMTDEDFYKISYKLEETDSRRDLITRTLKACIARVQVFDMTRKEMRFTDVPMDTGFDKLSADKQLAQVRKKIETAELVPLAVTGCDMREELRGTTKDKFISKAVPLNPETRQPYNTEETEG